MILIYRMFIVIIGILLLSSSLQCYGKGIPSVISSLIESNNNFAFSLYRNLQSDDKNLIFSPWSISMGLAMLYLGARNYTSREMEEVLYKNEAGVTAREMMMAYGQLDRLMKRRTQLELTQFNAAVVQQGSFISETYKHRLFHYFNSVLYDLDIANNGELVKEWVNILAEIKSHGLIKDLLAVAPTADSRLLLLNGIHYKGQWIEKFDQNNTAVEPFYNEAGVPTDAYTMLSTSNYSYRYSHLDGVHIVRLPMEGNFAMIFIMPIENGTLKEVGETLNFKRLQKILDEEAIYKTIKLALPRFKLDERLELMNDLEELGMHSLFSPSTADLSGIDGNKDLFLKDVVHKATVEVNEEGVEAAAATLLGVDSRLGVPYVNLNRPFMFLIQDLDTRLILFMGHLKNCKEVCGVSSDNDIQQQTFF